VLSCIDCGKDFFGDGYAAHTSCISEAEKYQGALFKPKDKANKGDAKQEAWLAALEQGGAKITDPKMKAAYEKIKAYPNVPRKERQFINFAKNSTNIYDEAFLKTLWSHFAPNKPPPQQQKQAGGAGVGAGAAVGAGGASGAGGLLAAAAGADSIVDQIKAGEQKKKRKANDSDDEEESSSSSKKAKKSKKEKKAKKSKKEKTASAEDDAADDVHVAKATKVLTKKLGRTPTAAEIAKKASKLAKKAAAE
jgi:cell growth-regulating nucleolar protein